MQTPPRPRHSRRSFLKQTSLLGAGSLLALRQEVVAAGPRKLLAYIGTYTSPLKNMRPTQVDLPPGNGRGIHLFEVNRDTGAMTAVGVHEMGTSPSCWLSMPTSHASTPATKPNASGRRSPAPSVPSPWMRPPAS